MINAELAEISNSIVDHFGLASQLGNQAIVLAEGGHDLEPEKLGTGFDCIISLMIKQVGIIRPMSDTSVEIVPVTPTTIAGHKDRRVTMQYVGEFACTAVIVGASTVSPMLGSPASTARMNILSFDRLRLVADSLDGYGRKAKYLGIMSNFDASIKTNKGRQSQERYIVEARFTANMSASAVEEVMDSSSVSLGML